MNPKLSIIIPIFNVSKYIAKCITSILDQLTLENTNDIEIIIVNDGTQDDSMQIASRLITDSNNIIIINQENKGLSAARNIGLKKASGDFIWFVDSDDSITNNALKIIWTYLTTDIDIISLTSNIIRESTNEIVLAPKGKIKQGWINPKEWLLDGYVYPYSGAQFYIYNRVFLNRCNLLFKEGIYFEDLLFTPQAICRANRIYHISSPVYNYLIRSGSITATVSLKKWRDYLIVVDELNKLSVNENNIINQRIFNSCISMIGGVIPKSSLRQLSKSEREIAREEYLKRNYWPSRMIKSYKKKYILRYFMVYFNLFK